ncbi:MAG: hypothetical protein DWI03_09830 [Planctomycetota bacterium]|nr:MAG: hypothetical protein DWI03_09830 [Planctomycetota bacterium]
MSDHRDIFTESRTLTLQAIVFRALRDRGLEPELSDTSATRVQPAEDIQEQWFRILVSTDIVAHLRSTIGLEEFERRWVHGVVDAVCRRHERRQRQIVNRRSMAVAHEPALVSTSTATVTATTVVFRRRTGGAHG